MSDFTLTQLAAINTAIASGTLKVRYADKEVTYHSLTELMAARDLIRSELQASGALASSSTTKGIATVTQYCSD